MSQATSSSGPLISNEDAQRLLGVCQQQAREIAELRSAVNDMITRQAHVPVPTYDLVPPMEKLHPGFKLQRNMFFSGTSKEDVDTWLFIVEQNLLGYGISEGSLRIQVAVMGMQNVAAQWWRHHCEQYPHQQINWEEFKRLVRDRFQGQLEAIDARTHLINLKQGNKNVDQYISAFQDLLAKVHGTMQEEDQITYFLNGLKGSVYAEVDRCQPHTLIEAITHARRYEIRSSRLAERRDHYISRYGTRFTRSSHPTTTSSFRGSEPMEISAMHEAEEDLDADYEKEYEEYLHEIEQSETANPEDEVEDELPFEGESGTHEDLAAINSKFRNNRGIRRRKLSKEEYIRLRKDGRCYECGSLGHLAKNCPKRGKDSQSSIKQ
jgi:hypothetical protein